MQDELCAASCGEHIEELLEAQLPMGRQTSRRYVRRGKGCEYAAQRGEPEEPFSAGTLAVT